MEQPDIKLVNGEYLVSWNGVVIPISSLQEMFQFSCALAEYVGRVQIEAWIKQWAADSNYGEYKESTPIPKWITDAFTD